ncbi:DUF5050 domain-containing protein [Clostridium thermarum]|uniref:DUF5050 domain-containing protein n=1 Tax=Clostridium thermarum TaxID=1716543 RepID=UPI0013D37266|nr:DUF5050 domain-containing protein [Clostridium thermarum]
MKNKIIIALTVILLITASTAVLLHIKNKEDTIPEAPQDKKTEQTSEMSPSSETSPSIEEKESLPTTSSLNVARTSKWGNTPANISNGGLFALQGGYLYFDTGNITERIPSLNSTKISRTKDDGITGLTLLSSRPYAFNINVVGDCLYYTSMQDIWKEKINGEYLERIKSGNISQLIIYDNVMYYLKDNVLEKCSLEDPESTLVVSDNVGYFVLSDDGNSIIYIEVDTNSDTPSYNADTKIILYKTDLEGKNKTYIFDLPIIRGIGSIMTYKNYIYFITTDEFATDENSFRSIYRVNTDNSEPELERFIDGSQYMDLSSINIFGDYLHFVVRPVNSKNLEIHRKGLITDDEDIIQVSNLIYVTSPIYVFDNKAYFIGGSIGQTSAFTYSMFWVDFDNKTVKENKGFN